MVEYSTHNLRVPGSNPPLATWVDICRLALCRQYISWGFIVKNACNGKTTRCFSVHLYRTRWRFFFICVTGRQILRAALADVKRHLGVSELKPEQIALISCVEVTWFQSVQFYYPKTFSFFEVIDDFFCSHVFGFSLSYNKGHFGMFFEIVVFVGIEMFVYCYWIRFFGINAVVVTA